MSTRHNSFSLTLSGAAAIGAVAGAGLGAALGGGSGVGAGAVIGAGGAALYAYVLAERVVASSAVTFRVLTTAAALGCGLMAGFFFCFSAVVMTSLAQQPTVAGWLSCRRST